MEPISPSIQKTAEKATYHSDTWQEVFSEKSRVYIDQRAADRNKELIRQNEVNITELKKGQRGPVELVTEIKIEPDLEAFAEYTAEWTGNVFKELSQDADASKKALDILTKAFGTLVTENEVQKQGGGVNNKALEECKTALEIFGQKFEAQTKALEAYKKAAEARVSSIPALPKSAGATTQSEATHFFDSLRVNPKEIQTAIPRPIISESLTKSIEKTSKATSIDLNSDKNYKIGDLNKRFNIFCFSPDGNYIVGTKFSDSEQVFIYSITHSGLEFHRSLHTPDSTNTNLERNKKTDFYKNNRIYFSLDGKYIIATGPRSTRIWAFDLEEDCEILKGPRDCKKMLALSSDGRCVVWNKNNHHRHHSDDGDGYFSFMTLELQEKGNKISRSFNFYETHILEPVLPIFIKNDKWLAIPDNDRVNLHSLEDSGQVEISLQYGKQKITALAASSDGKWLAIGSMDDIDHELIPSIYIWQIENLSIAPIKPLHIIQLREQSREIVKLAFSTDSKYIASTNRVVNQVWSAESGLCIASAKLLLTKLNCNIVLNGVGTDLALLIRNHNDLYRVPVSIDK